MAVLTVPSIGTVSLGMTAMFQGVAAAGTFFPSFVHDRVEMQFKLVWRFLLGVETAASSDAAPLADFLARASQLIIGGCEAVIALALLAAMLSPRGSSRRLHLANFGLALGVGLFSTFLIVLFAMHDSSLPKWNQYPSIIAWFGATWLIVSVTERPSSTGVHAGAVLDLQRRRP
jgi:hypothetical protein